MQELLPYYKQLLYRTCVLYIVLYRFPLQYFKNTPLFYPLKKLRKIQQRAVIQITRAFIILPTLGIEAIVDLIYIYLYLQKISSRNQLRTTSLLSNHVINLLLENRYSKNSTTYHLSLEKMTTKQRLKIKSSIIDTNSYLNGILFIQQTARIKKAERPIFEN